MPAGGFVDYEPCILATIPPGTELPEAFRRHGRYAVPGELLETLQAESAEERRARWAHVPAAVADRQPPWFV